MNKKGLTLVELLTVIVILSIIVVILFPTMRSLLSDSKSKIKTADKKSAREAAEMYVADHIDSFSTANTSQTITLTTLINEGYLEIDGDNYNLSSSTVTVTTTSASQTTPENLIYEYSVDIISK